MYFIMRILCQNKFVMGQKSKILLEYPINSSPTVLYNRLSTPSGLTEWFADDVIVTGKDFIFVWNGVEQPAQLIQIKEGKMVRYKWLDDEDEYYFEFSINRHELTGDVSLVVVDFSEEGEEEEVTELWNSQIADLKRVLGC